MKPKDVKLLDLFIVLWTNEEPWGGEHQTTEITLICVLIYCKAAIWQSFLFLNREQNSFRSATQEIPEESLQ